MRTTQNPDVKEKIRQEFDKIIVAPYVEETQQDFKMNEALSYEKINEFEYLQWCFNEELRFEPAGPFTNISCLSETQTVGGV